ncbi:MAG TPA: S9 family peptidase [Terriglobia bacterium]|nr:S9 family peptidase [Terriglobia bacterium]
MRTLIRLGFIWLEIAVSCLAANGRPITFEDLMKVQRISDPQVSPDGKWIGFVLAQVDLEANTQTKHIWMISTEGGMPIQMTRGSGSDSRPRWSPDRQSLAFISTRGGKSQVWLILLKGGEARQLTNISTEADGLIWARRGDTLLFTSQVYPDCADDACNGKRLEEFEKGKVKARIIDELLFRHWDSWREGKYTHLFAVSANGGPPQDLTPGAYDAPTFFLGAPDGYAVSPDGKEVCYTSNRSKPPSAVAWTTNNHLYLVSVTGGEAKDITPGIHGSDASPQYSPNGRYIAYTSQERNGYESDLFRLRVYDRESRAIKDVTPNFDQWVIGFVWGQDNDTIFFTAAERSRQPIFRTSLTHPRAEKVADGFFDELQICPDGKRLFCTSSTLTRPTEIYEVTFMGAEKIKPFSHINDALVAELDMNPAEPVLSRGAENVEAQSLLVKPPAFDPNKKYPGLLLIHGGPQAAWEDAWGYRWNAQIFAAHGYVVMMTNYHGSTGYGQKFVESISGDWGGAPYRDLMAATDYLASLPCVDRNRIGAAGASAGGYYINWIAGQTDRFKALVSHDGVYDNRSMYGETEELWFDEWEHGGVPWDKAKSYDKDSPSSFVANITTPLLIVQGALDFRVPDSQAFQLFSALQRRGVPSRLLYFPDEGHWVLKPQNSRLWYRTVLEWLDRYLKP